MPWCPQCDEVFPDGTHCPRCRAALTESEHAPVPAPPGLPQLRVPRRVRRRFERLNAPSVPTRGALAFALAMVVLAAAFAAGRITAYTSGSGAVVRQNLGAIDIDAPGSLNLITRSGAGSYALVRLPFAAGTPETLGHIDAPFVTGRRPRFAMTELGGSVAVVFNGARVAAFPLGRAPVAWITGDEAVWETPQSLLVRLGSNVRRWRFDDVETHEPVPGSWSALVQTPAGAALSGDHIAISGEHGVRAAMPLPPSGDVHAVAPDGSRALVSADGRLHVWDGTRLNAVGLDPHEVHGATFAASGGRSAVLLRERTGERTSGVVRLAVVDAIGAVTSLEDLAHLPADGMCDAPPTWDASGRWVFAAAGEGTYAALDTREQRVRRANVFGATSCASAWSA